MIIFLSCDFQTQKLEQHYVPPSPVIVENTFQSGNDWIRKEIALGKAGGLVVFDEKGKMAIVGAGFILLSNDNGESWNDLKGGKGSDLYTTDGGINYKKSFESNAFSDKKNDSTITPGSICSVENTAFASSGRLYIYSICEHDTRLLSVPTEASSDDWYVRRFGLDEKNDYHAPYKGLVFAGDRVLVDFTQPNKVSLSSTSDFGKNWVVFWTYKTDARVVSVDFVNDYEGYILLSNGKLLKTVNEGREWMPFSQLPTTFSGKISSTDFISLDIGYAVGEDGIILKTEDGGKTWGKQNSGVKSFLHKVAATDEKKVWAVGEDETVLETTNGGETWQKIELEKNSERTPLNNIYNLTVHEGKAWIVVNKFIYISP